MRIIVATWLVITSAQSFAAPTLNVKGRAEIELDPVSRKNELVAVAGTLRDRYAKTPIPNQGVTVTIGDQLQTPLTDDEGYFTASFPITDGIYDVSAVFAGAPEFSAARVSLEKVDVSKTALKISLEVPNVADHGTSLTVRGQASGKNSNPTLVLEATFNDGAEDVPLEDVQVTSGKFQFELTKEQIGEPGEKSIRLSFPGNAGFNPATSKANFISRATTTLSLVLKSSAILAYEARQTFTGTLTTKERLRPIPKAAITIVSGSRSVAQILTDSSGNYEISLLGAELGEGPHQLQALFSPTSGRLSPSRSAPLSLKVQAPQPSSPWPSVIVLFAVLAFVGLTAFLYQKTKNTPERSPTSSAPPVRGLNKARRKTSRRANHFTGTIVSIPKDVPLSGTLCWNEQEVFSSPDGRFSIESLPPGNHLVTCTAEGHVPETVAVNMPHKGEFSEVAIGLFPFREAMFESYRQLVLPLLPQKLVTVATPRQTIDYAKRHFEEGKLTELTLLVEKAYFAEATVNEMTLAHVNQRIDALTEIPVATSTFSSINHPHV